MGTAAASEPGGKSIQREKSTITPSWIIAPISLGRDDVSVCCQHASYLFRPSLVPSSPLFFLDVEPELEKCESEWVKNEEYWYVYGRATMHRS